MIFHTGTHVPNFVTLTNVPLFLSAIRMREWSPKESIAPLCIDSGGYSTLIKNGKWEITPKQYIKELNQWSRNVGKIEWAASQDHMCELQILKKTGKTVLQHIFATVENYLTLQNIGCDVEIIPVLQGYTLDDYKRCYEYYNARGVDLTKCNTVGIGTLCRREKTDDAVKIIQHFHSLGLKIHGFGFKKEGLKKVHRLLKSADSLAWSFGARYSQIRLEGHTHINCANCLEYMLLWRAELLAGLTDF